MKTINIPLPKQLKTSRFWLLVITACLIAINITLLWKIEDEAQLAVSFLFFSGIASILSDKRHTLNLESSVFPSLLGTLIIAFVLLKSSQIIETQHTSSLLAVEVTTTKHASVLRVLPFLSGLGCALIASGFKGLKQYQPELIILFFLGIPSVVLTLLVDLNIIDISRFTAATSAFLLSYLGFDVALQGVYIYLPTGSVQVNAACAGIDIICYMLGLSVLAVLVFPTKQSHRIPAVAFGIILAFLVNSVRVGLMAILVARGNKEAFDYMHEGTGSLVFGMIAVVIFGIFYMLLLRWAEGKNQDHLAVEETFFERD